MNHRVSTHDPDRSVCGEALPLEAEASDDAWEFYLDGCDDKGSVCGQCWSGTLGMLRQQHQRVSEDRK